MNLVEKYNQQSLAELDNKNDLPRFKVGDTLKVYIRVVDGANERIQIFEGFCLKRRNSGIGSSFTVRKISYSHGVERTWLLHSPLIAKIEITKIAKVRRAKLYYLRNLRGKAARIKENIPAMIAMQKATRLASKES